MQGKKAYSKYNSNNVQPFDIPSQQQQLLQPTYRGIKNKDSFMFTIALIYILQYSAQIGLVFSFLKNPSTIFLDLFGYIVLLIILIPFAVWNIKGLQSNPTISIIVILYQILYAVFLKGLIQIGSIQKEKPIEGEIHFGDYFVLSLFAIINILLNIQGLIQLVCSYVIIVVKGDDFDLKQFKTVGIIVSIISGLLFIIISPFITIFIAGIGIVFNYWFSAGLMKTVDDRSGIKSDQSMFGSFAVFVFMVCPCV